MNAVGVSAAVSMVWLPVLFFDHEPHEQHELQGLIAPAA
ncbi:hypothetical protein ABI_38840 [Asticcacaulis biprosthecium C19]|uniref:Uncharacterized protein n=1 Tax=Asticcacaulis biprosthecium C19 TaxID=715226 RepID=F4QRV1_9CAUL|nr:hypothetical protein ABI_38840 [Asticcacaulis biprosthecium C19]